MTWRYIKYQYQQRKSKELLQLSKSSGLVCVGFIGLNVCKANLLISYTCSISSLLLLLKETWTLFKCKCVAWHGIAWHWRNPQASIVLYCNPTQNAKTWCAFLTFRQFFVALKNKQTSRQFVNQKKCRYVLWLSLSRVFNRTEVHNLENKRVYAKLTTK